MMIGLWSDSHNFPSLPVMKLAAWHKLRGDRVELWQPLMRYDKVYCSKVFDFTRDAEDIGLIRADAVERGGTGYGDFTSQLPAEIEHIYPDYSLYPKYREAYGFLTRGCPRGCGFCIVSGKEGRESRRVAELSEFWRGQQVIKLLDPNLLACREHEQLLKELANSGAWVDFTQGLDIRLVTRDNVALLNRLKVKALHFAWDDPRMDLTRYFEEFSRLSVVSDYRKRKVYVLTNYSSTHEQDLYRVYTLRQLGFDPYIMIYDKNKAPHITRRLQRWCNNKWIFRAEPDFTKYTPNCGDRMDGNG